MIRVMLFAGIAEKIEKKELIIERDQVSIRDIQQLLTEQYPVLEQDLAKAMFAVNEEFCDEDKIVQDKDIVAIIPPVSGG